jgi:hypothetical protein
MAIYHQILYVQSLYLKIERKERFVWLKQKKGGWKRILQPPFELSVLIWFDSTSG